ncbi:MAG TPA: GNAT family N-acetyltransferase, partial [Chloroflexota bacterium]|nr:GNAT family N-acetyltransferase [Chloroflexota bacterium]
ALERLRPEWDRLLGESDADIFFLRNEWQQLWWRHFGHDFSPRVVTARDGSGHLVGVAPLMAPRHDSESTLSFIGGTEIADYLDLIVERSQAREVRGVLLRAVCEHLPWRTLDLHCLPEGSGTVAAVQELASPAVHVTQEVEDVSPTVALGGSWDAYLASLRKKDRHELRRKLRRAIDDLGAHWQTLQAPAELPAALDAFVDLHRRSSTVKAAFMTEAMAAYFRELAAMTLASGQLRMGILWAGDQALSTAMGFAYGDRLYLYNSGFDPAYAAHSVGIAAVGLLLRAAADEGLALFDFLQGNEAYKYTLGAQDHPVYRLIAGRGETA